ncbi:cytochrome c553 [Paraburkholderia sp. BL8N3]|nr:c-type cytochrome [Paraburkholderia sp. BL8N3]TCK33834.1 cytochrome c553 [Paraburkholderia sp. BL8N3]
MKTERIFSLQNRWFTVTVGGALALVIFSALVGFIWLPSAQSDQRFQGVWNAICSAAGVPQQWLRNSAKPPVSLVRTSTVIMTPQLLNVADSSSIGRGATLATRCLACHSAAPIPQNYFPILAGQHAAVIYKQLHDFHSGAREDPIMTAMAGSLKDQDMRDLAEYYASLPGTTARSDLIARRPPAVVASGSPMRNIASCAACHGPESRKPGSPVLQGLPAQYLRMQLRAFSDGVRHNDINGQMRNIARNMTADEIDEAAQYYADVSNKK